MIELPFTDMLPPSNVECEECVLGSMLLDNAAIDDVAVFLKAEDFWREEHQVLYRAILSLHGEGSPADAITLIERLTLRGEFRGVGGDDVVRRVLEAPPHAVNAAYYGQIVRQKAVARRLIEQANRTLRDCYSNNFDADTLLEAAQARVFAIGEDRPGDSTIESSEAVLEAMEAIERRRHGEVDGVPSGFAEIDDLTGGFQPGTLTILAARPSMGKSAMALNVADHAAVAAGVVPYLVSLEMSGPEIALRMLGSRSGVDGYNLRNAYSLTTEQRIKLDVAAGELRAHAFPLDHSPGRTITQIASNARRLKARRGIGLIVVDYLQLLEGDGESRQEQVAKISRRLKQVARELALPVIALSQLNRQAEGREDHRPRMSDLRESGAIEQDADVIILIHRPEYYDPEDEPGMAVVNVAKNRNGAVGVVKLAFHKPTAKFESLYPGGP